MRKNMNDSVKNGVAEHHRALRRPLCSRIWVIIGILERHLQSKRWAVVSVAHLGSPHCKVGCTWILGAIVMLCLEIRIDWLPIVLEHILQPWKTFSPPNKGWIKNSVSIDKLAKVIPRVAHHGSEEIVWDFFIAMTVQEKITPKLDRLIQNIICLRRTL